MKNWVRPLDDEIFYSIVSRDYLISGMEEADFLSEKLGLTSLGVYSIKLFQEDNVEEIISKYSMLPMLQPFMSKKDNLELIETIKDKGKYRYVHEPRGYKICPECYKEDLQKYGQWYLRREYQVEINKVCYKYLVDLIVINNREKRLKRLV